MHANENEIIERTKWTLCYAGNNRECGGCVEDRRISRGMEVGNGGHRAEECEIRLAIIDHEGCAVKLEGHVER